jgi:hypothetical protein
VRDDVAVFDVRGQQDFDGDGAAVITAEAVAGDRQCTGVAQAALHDLGDGGSEDSLAVEVEQFDGAGYLNGAYSGVTWARIPAAPGQRFRNDAGANSGSTWALIPA